MTLEITVEGVDYDDLDERRGSDSRAIASHLHDYLTEAGFDVETVGLGEPEAGGEMLCKRVSGDGTSYTVLAQEVDPDAHPALKDVGYRSPTVLFTVLTDGGDAVTSHDRYEAVRQLDGADDWLLSELDLIEDDVRDL